MITQITLPTTNALDYPHYPTLLIPSMTPHDPSALRTVMPFRRMEADGLWVAWPLLTYIALPDQTLPTGNIGLYTLAESSVRLV